MTEILHDVLPDGPDVRDPSLHVATSDGQIIPSAEYYDLALSGWASDDPYVQLADLEDAMAGRAYAPSRRQQALAEPPREVELFIRRPVVAADDLMDILQVVAPFHNRNHGTRVHKLGTDRENGLHTTVLNTRGLRGIDLPDEETFDPARRVPALGQGLGALSIAGVEILQGSPNYHVALLYGHRAISKLSAERHDLEREHFPGLQFQAADKQRIFRPHVTLLSTSQRAIAVQALDTIHRRASLPKRIGLAPAQHTFYQTLFAPAQR